MIPPDGQPPFWCDWYIDIVRAFREGSKWNVTDLYMDVGVHEGLAYTLKDVDEVGEALTERLITRQDAAYILHALHDVTHDLRDKGYSGAALLGAYLDDMEKADRTGAAALAGTLPGSPATGLRTDERRT
jgi:predicted RNA-binding protein associated with RNAse of E/G family